MEQWSPTVAVGDTMIAAFEVRHGRPIVQLDLDLWGDGMDGVTVHGVDLRAVRALALVPQVRGTFDVQLRAYDDLGCLDATGQARPVKVR